VKTKSTASAKSSRRKILGSIETLTGKPVRPVRQKVLNLNRGNES
jgi:hypothetical protein